MPEITHDQFVELLSEIMDEEKASALLTIPGVYEPVSEYFNNEVLKRWKDRQDEEE